MSRPTLSYRLSFPDRRHHYVDVDARISTLSEELELFLPVWTPGSYLVREYANHIEGLAARDASGAPVAWRKTRKNRWRLAGGTGEGEISLRYRVYARTLSVQDCFVDASFASLNGAGLFLAPVGATDAPCELVVELPEDWGAVHTALPRAGGEPHRFVAESYDRLIDSPIYAGNPAARRFLVADREHLLIHEGGGALWDSDRSAADLRRIVEEELAFWGEAPYERYLFLNLLADAGGSGLEHRDSTLLLASHWAMRTRKGYLDWLSLTAHEFFHTWNVKRLRPRELGPFDYENENYTTGLWVAEGITSYYDDLLVHRAGLASEKEYLELLGGHIERLQTTPGRLVQTLEAASYDTWIKFYRRDESSVNTAISYYTKGAVVAFLLDHRLRAATGGAKSLDDLMRLAYRRFGGDEGFDTAAFEAAASELAGEDLTPFFDFSVRSTGELDFAPALAWLGLRFRPPEPRPADEPARGWLGAKTERRRGALLVTEVPRGTPAWEAGLEVGDEIAGVDGFRVRAELWEKRLEAFPPGSESRLLVARRERWLELPLRFGEEPSKRWRLEVDPEATPEQAARRSAWLASARASQATEETLHA